MYRIVNVKSVFFSISNQVYLHPACFLLKPLIYMYLLSYGGGPGIVVSTAAFHASVRGSVPGLGSLKETKMFLPHSRVKVSIAGSLCDREVACSASDRQGSNFESCVWRTVSSQSYHHPQEVLLAQFSLYVHKGGLKPNSFHFFTSCLVLSYIVFTFGSILSRMIKLGPVTAIITLLEVPLSAFSHSTMDIYTQFIPTAPVTISPSMADPRDCSNAVSILVHRL